MKGVGQEVDSTGSRIKIAFTMILVWVCYASIMIKSIKPSP